MRAVRVHEFGAGDILVEEDVEPKPGHGEVLIKDEAASVNFAVLEKRS